MKILVVAVLLLCLPIGASALVIVGSNYGVDLIVNATGSTEQGEIFAGITTSSVSHPWTGNSLSDIQIALTGNLADEFRSNPPPQSFFGTIWWDNNPGQFDLTYSYIGYPGWDLPPVQTQIFLRQGGVETILTPELDFSSKTAQFSGAYDYEVRFGTPGTAVPEPSSLCLFLTGAGSLVGFLRLRRS